MIEQYCDVMKYLKEKYKSYTDKIVNCEQIRTRKRKLDDLNCTVKENSRAHKMCATCPLVM